MKTRRYLVLYDLKVSLPRALYKSLWDLWVKHGETGGAIFIQPLFSSKTERTARISVINPAFARAIRRMAIKAGKCKP